MPAYLGQQLKGQVLNWALKNEKVANKGIKEVKGDQPLSA
jgi:hypothetical protein